MGVNHRRLDILVPEQFLHRSDIVARFEQVRGEAVTKCVAGDPFVQSRQLRRETDLLLETAGAYVVSAHDAGPRVERKPATGEDVLPNPFAIGGRELAFEGEG